MQKTSQATKDTPRLYRGCHWLLRLTCGALLGVATVRALALLPSPLVEFRRLGFVDTLPILPNKAHLAVAALAGVLYALIPPLGGVVAFGALLLPMAFFHVGLAGVYAVLALLCLPCLAKQEGVLILVLIPLALAYPAFALFLPLVPVLAGLLGGRFLGVYIAVIAALVLIVLGMVTGQAMVGGVTIGGDQDSLMVSEGVAFVTEKVKLMPPEMYEDPRLATTLRDAVREGNTGHIAAWLYLMLNWWGPVCLVGPAMTFLELYPRLLAPHLVGLVVLWAIVAGAAAWGTWLVTQKLSAKQILKVGYVAIIGVTLTIATAVGCSLLPALCGGPSLSLGVTLSPAVVSSCGARSLSVSRESSGGWRWHLPVPCDVEGERR
jgi:hypothetical protein